MRASFCCSDFWKIDINPLLILSSKTDARENCHGSSGTGGVIATAILIYRSFAALRLQRWEK
jgi:hypothetical protein